MYAKPSAICRTFNQSRHIGNHKTAVSIYTHHTQIRVQRGKRIICHFRFSC